MFSQVIILNIKFDESFGARILKSGVKPADNNKQLEIRLCFSGKDTMPVVWEGHVW